MKLPRQVRSIAKCFWMYPLFGHLVGRAVITLILV